MTATTTQQQLTKVSVADIEPNRRRGGDLRITLSPRTVGCTSGFGGILRLEPGDFITKHRHPYSEEFVHCIAGELDFTIGDEVVHLSAGDSVVVPIDVPHRLVNNGDVQAHCVFHLAPLAPRPDLGHVDMEDLVAPSAPQLDVGAEK